MALLHTSTHSPTSRPAPASSYLRLVASFDHRQTLSHVLRILLAHLLPSFVFPRPSFPATRPFLAFVPPSDYFAFPVTTSPRSSPYLISTPSSSPASSPFPAFPRPPSVLMHLFLLPTPFSTPVPSLSLPYASYTPPHILPHYPPAPPSLLLRSLFVVDPDAVPKAVAKERPASKKSTVYAIRFFPAGDYAWLAPKELTRLTTAQINEYVTQDAGGRKAGDLMEGYKKDVAIGPDLVRQWVRDLGTMSFGATLRRSCAMGRSVWLVPMRLTCLDALGAFGALDPVAWEEEHAANPPAAKKRKSKSKAKKKGEDGDEEDELAADDAAEEEPEEEAEEDEEKEKAGKKRKRASSPAPAKSKAKAPKAAKAKKGGKAKKSKTTVESEDDAGEEAEAEGEEGGEDGEARASKKAKAADGSAAQLESDPEALKVREWRHKLQKTFLSSNKSLPKEEEMPAVDSLFTTVEGYQNMNIEYLTFSKIGKVMRHIHLLEPGKVPRDDEFKFRDRAKALVDKWHGILNANKATDGESAAVTESTARMDLNGTGEGDLTVMDVTMNGDEA
ncbi:hypothetical protein DFH06DRAFT_1482421 [Mycena polygramma]|nr:hypothetical protein DFH06DRAFT_1482421 [Mycena polygramma]